MCCLCAKYRTVTFSLFPCFLHHQCHNQILYPTNFLVENVFIYLSTQQCFLTHSYKAPLSSSVSTTSWSTSTHMFTREANLLTTELKDGPPSNGPHLRIKTLTHSSGRVSREAMARPVSFLCWAKATVSN